MGDKEQVMECSKAIAFANNQLALNLLKVLSQSGKNIFFSPFSISIAMAMLLRGAKAETMEELMQVLGHKKAGLSFEEVHRQFADFFRLLSQNSGKYTLDLANGIFSGKGFQMMPDYVDDMKRCYQAFASELNFANDSALKFINEWVKEKTKTKIPQLLKNLGPATVAVLLNAVYFKGSWVEKFDPKKTKKQKFFNNGAKGSAKNVPMMFKKAKFLYADNGEFRALELPYEGDDIAMMILLPKDLVGVLELEKSLDMDFIANLHNRMVKIEVHTTMPKFHMEYSEDLVSAFKKLGLERVFDARLANLTGLNDSGPLEVSQIIHKAVLDVNEEGSEAAAATAVIIGRCLPRHIEFQVDHPFLFIIYNKKNDMILFMGRVNEL